MDKTPAYYIFLGLFLGAVSGAVLGAMTGNAIHGMQLGTLAGLFIGWVLAATSFQK